MIGALLLGLQGEEYRIALPLYQDGYGFAGGEFRGEALELRAAFNLDSIQHQDHVTLSDPCAARWPVGNLGDQDSMVLGFHLLALFGGQIGDGQAEFVVLGQYSPRTCDTPSNKDVSLHMYY